MDYNRTVSEKLYGSDCPVMKEMRNWGRSGMTSYCSVICNGSSSWLRLKAEKSIVSNNETWGEIET